MEHGTDDERGQAPPGDAVDLWLGAAVWCDGGRIGTVSGFVCTQGATRVRDLIVVDDARAHGHHRVAVDDVAAADRADLTLRVSADTVRARPLETSAIEVDDVDLTWWTDLELGTTTPWLAAPTPVQLVVSQPDLSEGEVLVGDAGVEAGGHHVGRVSGMRATPAGELTAVIVDVGHRWHHRHVLVPAAGVDELTETAIVVRGTRAEVRDLPEPHARDQAAPAADLSPASPHDVGVGEADPDSAHAEAAHLLADAAGPALRDRGFTDAQINEWADAYLRAEGSGGVDGLIAWIEARER